MSIAKITITQTFDITEETVAKAVKAYLDNYDYGDLMYVSTTYLGFIADQLINSGNPQKDEMWKLVVFESLKKKRKELLEAFLYELGESYMAELNRIYDNEKEKEQ